MKQTDRTDKKTGRTDRQKAEPAKHNSKEMRFPRHPSHARCLSALRRLIDWGLTARSAQTGYIVSLISMLQLKSGIGEKVDNVTCWEYIQ